MKPILSATSTLTGNGYGRLADAITCTVTHEINGEYELKMTYPVTGTIFDYLANDCVIWADSDNFTKMQGFRIYRITRPLNGVVSVYARHICYDMSGFVCSPMNQTSLTTALANLASNCVPSPCPFTFTSPRTVATAYKTATPMNLWQMMGGVQGSLLDIYGGEWDFDNYTATLRTQLGSDRGVNIRYGKNMTELEQDATIEAQYGGIFPFWYDAESGTLVTLPENYVTVAGGGSRVLCIDFTNDFEDAPTEAQLRARANQYATANNVADPKISWKVAFIPLSMTEEYKGIAALESVKLGDTVHVFYEPMNLTASARVVKTDYNVLADRFDSVTLGRVKQNLAKIVVEQKKDLEHSVSLVKSTLEHAIDEATDFITNGAGYMRFIYNSSNELVEIVSLDNPDINNATNVWRWNNGGFGFSANGYGGPYTTAIYQSGSDAGAIVADFITAGTLNANVIRAGLITDVGGDNSWDLDTSVFTMTKGSININTSSSTTDSIKLNYSAFGQNWVSKLTPSYLYVSDNGGQCFHNALGLQGPAYTTPTAWQNSVSVDGSAVGVYFYNTSGDKAEYTETGVSLSKWSSGAYAENVKITTGGLIQLDHAGTIAVYNGSSSKYSALIWPDSNGAGRIVLGSGTSQVWRTSLENTGLTFRDASDNVTATYPNTGLYVSDLNDCRAQLSASSGTARTYTLTQGTYLLTIVRYNSTATTYDGVWLVQAHATNSHLTQIVKGTNAPSPSISALTLSLTTSSANQRVTITRLG